MITLTEKARNKFIEAAEAEGRKGHGLRIIVTKGGTSQPEFGLNFVGPEDVRDDDQTIDAGGLEVHIDVESARWLKDATVDFIEEAHQSGFKVDAPHAGLRRPEGPVADAVQKVLNDQINPAVASHGGVVSLVAMEDDGTVFLRFGGGCQGCGMINVTLKQGVEKVLFENVPEVKKVMDVTDHAAGENPYYEPAK